jgi:hypothetical protein
VEVARVMREESSILHQDRKLDECDASRVKE